MSENHADLNVTFHMMDEFITSDQFLHEFNYEFISQTCFASHSSSHLFIKEEHRPDSRERQKLNLGAW